MNVQVLVAAMQQDDHSLIKKMNLQTDAIIGNQCDKNSIEVFQKGGKNFCYLNFYERGVGLNRNNALMRASGDICMFADDDMRYFDNYESIVQKAFEKNPKADVIIFNLKEPTATRYIIKKSHRVGRFNYLRYGTARIAFKLKSIKENAIYFNQCFGGGTEHCHGEDNLFLTACLDKKLKVIAVPDFIAELTEERDSTWLKEYDEKYFVDQGFLYKTISKKWWKLLCLQDAVRHKRLYKKSIIEVYKMMTSLKK